MAKTSLICRPNRSADELHYALKSALETMAAAEQTAIKCFGEIMN